MHDLRLRLIVLAALLVLTGIAPAQILRFVADLDPRPATPSLPFEPTQLTRVGALTYFVQQSEREGIELWVTDGTRSGTRLVRDIQPGPANSFPRELTPIEGTNRLVFTADDGVHGREPWVSDGTAGGTFLLRDIRVGSVSSNPTGLEFFANRAWFRADNGVVGPELWSANGKRGETQLVGDLRAGPLGSGPTNITRVDNALYMSADDGVRGREAYMVTGNKTMFPIDVNPGAASSNPEQFGPHPVSGTLFSADLPNRGREVVRFRNSNIFLLPEIRSNGSASPQSFVRLANGRSLFTAEDGLHGRELFTTDGVTIALVKDIRPGSSSSGIRDLTVLGGVAIFVANDGVRGVELWRSDGTRAGTQLLADLRPGSGSAVPQGLERLGGKVFFSAAPPTGGRQLFMTDGTTAGTVRVVDIHPNGNAAPTFLTGDDQIVWCAAAGPNIGRQVFRVDVSAGTAAPVRLLNLRTFGSNPSDFLPINGTGSILFTATTPATGREVFRSDGTAAGTRPVVDLVPGPVGSNPTDLMAIDGRMFFVAQGRFFETDGTAAGTRPASQQVAQLSELTVFEQKIVGNARTSATGGEPFVFDPDKGVIEFLGDFMPGRLTSFPGDFAATPLGCFFALTTQAGRELFLTDGTPAGTRLVVDLDPQGSGNVQRITRFADQGVLFTARVNGEQLLHFSDGTAAGTKPVTSTLGLLRDVREIVEIPSLRTPQAFVVGHTGNGVMRLFRTDGRTFALHNVQGSPAPDPRGLVAAGQRVFLSALGPAGRELYSARGAGTMKRVDDILPGPVGAMLIGAPLIQLGAGSEVVFGATDGVHGFELWSSGGTSSTTRMIVDAIQGTEGLTPVAMAKAGGAVFLVADDGETGHELYVLDQRRLQASLAIKFSRSCAVKGKRRPELGVFGVPEIGNVDFALTLKAGKRSTPVGMFFGVQRAAVSLGPCQFSVNALITVVANTNNEGALAIPIPIPTNVSLIGQGLHAQAAIVDSNGAFAGSLDFSEAIELVVGKSSGI